MSPFSRMPAGWVGAMGDLRRERSAQGASCLARWRGLPADGTAKTLAVAFAVAVVCATFVSTAAIAFRPRQRENRERERRDALRQIVARLPGVDELLSGADGRDVETEVVDLATGQLVPSVDAAAYDARKAAQDPEQSVAIPGDLDLAGLGVARSTRRCTS